MLVLSRFEGQKIFLTMGEEKVTITVVDVRGDKVRLGFEAPRSVKIVREEVQQAIDREGGKTL